MIFVDTGFLIALAQPTDSLHRRARAWATINNEKLLVTQFVLLEVVNSFSRLADRHRAHIIAAHIAEDTGYELLYASAEDFQEGLALHEGRVDKEWSLTDCISFHVMAKLKIVRALAHDMHFEQAGFEALLRRDP